MHPSGVAYQQADHAAVITALRAVRERLRGQRISARTDDPQALARAAFMLIEITAVRLAERQETGRAEEEAWAEAIDWLEAQAAHAEIELLESGPCSAPRRRCSATGHRRSNRGETSSCRRRPQAVCGIGQSWPGEPIAGFRLLVPGLSAASLRHRQRRPCPPHARSVRPQ